RPARHRTYVWPAFRLAWVDLDRPSANRMKVRLHARPDPGADPPVVKLWPGTTAERSANASWSGVKAQGQDPKDDPGSEYEALEYEFDMSDYLPGWSPPDLPGLGYFTFSLENQGTVAIVVDGVSVYQSVP